MLKGRDGPGDRSPAGNDFTGREKALAEEEVTFDEIPKFGRRPEEWKAAGAALASSLLTMLAGVLVSSVSWPFTMFAAVEGSNDGSRSDGDFAGDHGAHENERFEDSAFGGDEKSAGYVDGGWTEHKEGVDGGSLGEKSIDGTTKGSPVEKSFSENHSRSHLPFLRGARLGLGQGDQVKASDAPLFDKESVQRRRRQSASYSGGVDARRDPTTGLSIASDRNLRARGAAHEGFDEDRLVRRTLDLPTTQSMESNDSRPVKSDTRRVLQVGP